MPIHKLKFRKPEKDTEEERVYNWWWPGSIWGDPKPDEFTYSLMNMTYDAYKKRGISEERIYKLPETEPNHCFHHGELRQIQGESLRKRPAQREAKNAELRN